jgi:MFS family permease
MILTLSVHPSRFPDPLTIDRMQIDPPIPANTYHDSFGNFCHVIRAPAGRMSMSTDFLCGAGQAHFEAVMVVVQSLDGITAAVLAVTVTLIIADLTRETGHFNLGQGVIGTATGLSASLSTTLAGYLSDHFGYTLSHSQDWQRSQRRVSLRFGH